MWSLPLQFLLLTIAGWMTRDHQKVTEYLLTENAVLREQLCGRHIVVRRKRVGGVLNYYHREAA